MAQKKDISSELDTDLWAMNRIHELLQEAFK